MRYPIARVRPLEDDEVDRLGVEAQQCVELTNTNRSRAYPKDIQASFSYTSYSVFRVYSMEYVPDDKLQACDKALYSHEADAS